MPNSTPSDQKLKDSTRPDYIRARDIVSEMLAGQRSDAPAIILCAGIPTKPCCDELLKQLATVSSAVYDPRYKGTWESPGEFLERSPKDDIIELIDHLSDKHQRFILVGSSFGGAVVLEAADHPLVKSVIALSPVISFRTVRSFETLESYLTEMFPGAYRFATRNWQRLANDEILCPAKNIVTLPQAPVHIFYGENDPQISPVEISQFASRLGIPATRFPLGHISPRHIIALWKDIEAMIAGAC